MKRVISKIETVEASGVTVEIHDHRYPSGVHEISYHVPAVLAGAQPIMVAVVSRILLKPRPSRWTISALGEPRSQPHRNRTSAHNHALALCVKYEKNLTPYRQRT